MVQTTFGPRRLVLQNAQNSKEDGRLRGAPVASVDAGNVNMYSFANPGLKSEQTYTATFVQSITYPGGDPTRNLTSTKQFRTAGSPYTLDSTLVNSVYPPAGHSDYWNVLPHVLFNNPQIPWAFQGGLQDKPDDPTPWLALLVFTEDELTPYYNQLDTYNIPNLQRTPTFAYNLQIKDLVGATNLSQPIPINTDTRTDTTQIQAIFVQKELYSNLFGLYDNTSIAKAKDGNTQPSLTRYKYMTHVRQFNTTGLANRDAMSATELAVTVSPRTGPSGISGPQIAYAHLISLAGIDGNANMNLTTSQPAALISLYSWSFTYIPPLSFAAQAVLTELGKNLQPLRLPDPTLAAVETAVGNESQADSWVKLKMLAGYSVVNYRTPTGEQSIALNRSILSPVKGDPFDFPPSSYGSDLAVVDENSGFLDLTYQLAWELGRTMAVGDRTFAAALMRLRRVIHSKTLESAKKNLDQAFVPITTVIGGNLQLQDNLTKRLQQQKIFAPQRWLLAPQGTSTKTILSFQNPSVHLEYQSQLQSGIGPLALAVTPPVSNQQLQSEVPKDYDESNDPESSDYATVLAWIMDKWFLQGIPFANLLPDPGYLPKESVRSFYVDANWFKVFVDGVLSISEHFNEGDDVREAIKKSLTDYLAANVSDTGFPPQVPKWGLFIRSEFVTKFPDLRISAPFADSGMTGNHSEVLRSERLDTDLLLLLFDREPGDFSSQGITLSPPEHQLSCMFGSEEGVSASSGLLPLEWKPVSAVPGPTTTVQATPFTLKLGDPANGMYDPACRALCPVAFANAAIKSQQDLSDTYAKSAIVGAQLIAMVPSMQLMPPGSGLQVPLKVAPTLTTSKGQLEQPVNPPSGPLVVNPPLNTISYVTLPTYPTPASDMVRAVAKLNVYPVADSYVVSKFFQPTNPRQHAPPMVTTPNVNKPTDGTLAQCYLNTPMMNVRYQAAYGYQAALVSFYPLSLGLKTDITIPMTSLAESSQFLVAVSIDIGVEPASTLTFPQYLLAPFPVNKAVQPTRNTSGEWPLQPNHCGTKLNGDLLPNGRMTGPNSRRWLVRTAYSGNTFTITLQANRQADGTGAPPYWDINTYRDLGLVIEDVQVNCMEGFQMVPPPGWRGPLPYYYDGVGSNCSAFTITVTEIYWDSGSRTKQTAVGTSPVNVYGIDPHYKDITPQYRVPEISMP